MANLEDVIIDDTASIASSTVQSFIHTTDKANNTLTQALDNSSQTAADLQELPVVTSCNDLILNVDHPPSSNSSVSSQHDDHIFRI